MSECFLEFDVGVHFKAMGTTTISLSLIVIGRSPMSHRWKLPCPSVFLTIGDSSMVHESPSAVRRNSDGA
ncbi:hypothetical protein HAX54_012495, partial [Datura stramonium]|nr:hypothetical protein [Datura stramonium]